MPLPRSRTIRLDLSPSLYGPLEFHAEKDDMGVQDLLRRILVQWVDVHPLPEDVDIDA